MWRGAIPLIILNLMVSCSSSDEANLDDLKSHIANESNGLFKRLVRNGYTIDVTIQPIDLLIHRELNNSPATPIHLQRLREKYAKSLYLVMGISKDGKEALRFQNLSVDYSQILQTMSFGMSQHVELITSRGRSRPSDYIMDRTFGLGASNNFLFAFDRSELAQAESFDISLEEFGLGIGNQVFRFQLEDLNEVPRLQFAVSQSVKSLNDF